MLPTLYKKSSAGAILVWEVGVRATPVGFAEIVTRHGQVGGAIQEGNDLVTVGKNIGRSNETTPLEQAQAEAKAKWTKKKESRRPWRARGSRRSPRAISRSARLSGTTNDLCRYRMLLGRDDLRCDSRRSVHHLGAAVREHQDLIEELIGAFAWFAIGYTAGSIYTLVVP